jgi:hypothetical protein
MLRPYAEVGGTPDIAAVIGASDGRSTSGSTGIGERWLCQVKMRPAGGRRVLRPYAEVGG